MTSADPVSRYPLAWPLGWRRTVAARRDRANFAKHSTRNVTDAANTVVGTTKVRTPLTVAQAIGRLAGELGRLGATDEVLSTNLQTRLDGLPRSGQAEPTDPGAAVYFRLKGKPRCLACDRWDRVADNIAAIAQHVDALRRIDRYGVGTMEQAFAGYAALTTSVAEWWQVLKLSPTATLIQVEEAYKRLAKEHHPDVGGSHEAMAKLSEARETARALLGGTST